jgi:hypothetical protein
VIVRTSAPAVLFRTFQRSFKESLRRPWKGCVLLEATMRYLNVHPTLGLPLNDIVRPLRKRLEQRARNHDLTRSQWQAIAYLSKNEGVHKAGLAELLEIDSITPVRSLDRLAGRGPIERRQHSPDRATPGCRS